MTQLTRLLWLVAVAFGTLVPAMSFGQSQESILSKYRYAAVPTQTFNDGRVDPYGLGKRLRERIAADTSWTLLTDVEVTTPPGLTSFPPWQTIAASEFIAQDSLKLAQTVWLSVETPGGRGRIEVSVVAHDILGRELARFKGVSGLFKSPDSRERGALDKAIALLSQARPRFIATTTETEKVALDEAQVRSYLAATPRLAPIEGIWSDRDGTFRIAIQREQGTPQFVGVVLSSKHPFWVGGMVKARFEPTADPAVLLGHYRLDNHQEQLVMFRVDRTSLVSQSTGLGVTFVRLDTGEVRRTESTPPVVPSPVPPVTTSPGRSPESLHRIGTGTAFVVGQNLIATNFHVINGGTAWELKFPSADEALPLELVVADKANDLAVMRVKSASSLKPLSVVAARGARLGEDVYSVGFPLAGLLSDGHKVSTGVVSGLAGLDNDPRFFQLTVPTQPGNSGGPIFNSKGEVVGILASTLSVDYFYKETRTIPQNVNFAIKSDYLLLLMDQADSGTAAAVNVSPSGASRVDQIANAQESIGLVSTFGVEDYRSSTPPSAPTAPKVPALEVAYRHPTGPNILVRQRDTTATITFYRVDSSIYGNGSVSWNQSAGGFFGFWEVPYVCGSIDTRVITIRSELELFVESAGTLRIRVQMPSGLNCTRNQWMLTWGEDRWYP